MTRRDEWKLLRKIRKLRQENDQLKSWNYNQGETIIRLLEEKQILLRQISS